MATANVDRVTIDQIQTRRQEILQQIGDPADLRRRAAMHTIRPDEQELLDELQDLEFLLALQPQHSTSTSPPTSHPTKRRTTAMPMWTITYDDGEQIREETIRGKLSLDPSWAFFMETGQGPSTITLAVPAHRVIDIRQEGAL